MHYQMRSLLFTAIILSLAGDRGGDTAEVLKKRMAKILSNTSQSHGHQHTRVGSVTQGQYRTPMADGRVQVVQYIADAKGYRANITYEIATLKPKNGTVKKRRISSSHIFDDYDNNLNEFSSNTLPPTTRSHPTFRLTSPLFVTTPSPIIDLTNQNNRFINSTPRPFKIDLKNSHGFPPSIHSTVPPSTISPIKTQFPPEIIFMDPISNPDDNFIHNQIPSEDNFRDARNSPENFFQDTEIVTTENINFDTDSLSENTLIEDNFNQNNLDIESELPGKFNVRYLGSPRVREQITKENQMTIPSRVMKKQRFIPLGQRLVRKFKGRRNNLNRIKPVPVNIQQLNTINSVNPFISNQQSSVNNPKESFLQKTKTSVKILSLRSKNNPSKPLSYFVKLPKHLENRKDSLSLFIREPVLKKLRSSQLKSKDFKQKSLINNRRRQNVLQETTSNIPLRKTPFELPPQAVRAKQLSHSLSVERKKPSIRFLSENVNPFGHTTKQQIQRFRSINDIAAMPVFHSKRIRPRKKMIDFKPFFVTQRSPIILRKQTQSTMDPFFVTPKPSINLNKQIKHSTRPLFVTPKPIILRTQTKSTLDPFFVTPKPTFNQLEQTKRGPFLITPKPVTLFKEDNTKPAEPFFASPQPIVSARKQSNQFLRPILINPQSNINSRDRTTHRFQRLFVTPKPLLDSTPFLSHGPQFDTFNSPYLLPFTPTSHFVSATTPSPQTHHTFSINHGLIPNRIINGHQVPTSYPRIVHNDVDPFNNIIERYKRRSQNDTVEDHKET